MWHSGINRTDQKVFEMSCFRLHVLLVLRLNQRSCILNFHPDHTHPILRVHKLWVDDKNVDFVRFQACCFVLFFSATDKDFDMRVIEAEVKGLISALTGANKNLTFHLFQILCNNFAFKATIQHFFHWNSNMLKHYSNKAFSQCSHNCMSLSKELPRGKQNVVRILGSWHPWYSFQILQAIF